MSSIASRAQLATHKSRIQESHNVVGSGKGDRARGSGARIDSVTCTRAFDSARVAEDANDACTFCASSGRERVQYPHSTTSTPSATPRTALPLKLSHTHLGPLRIHPRPQSAYTDPAKTMSDRTGGRVPSIRTNVHQRSLSRSTSASGSVPSSPKTHEFVHLDDELASKQSSNLTGSGLVAETEPEVASNGISELVAAEKPVEDIAVRRSLPFLTIILIFFTMTCRCFYRRLTRSQSSQ